MALYFYFNSTTGDLVYSDKATYDVDGYTSLGKQSNMNPSSSSSWVYNTKRNSIKTVSKDPAIVGKITGLTSMSFMFGGCPKLTDIDLSGFDTTSVTNMQEVFRRSGSLTNLDLSDFNTASATNMYNMFAECSSLTSLDLSNFNTTAVTNMSNMFYHCSGLTSLDLSNFNTSAVTDMSIMFCGCSGLTSLDLSNFNTSAVTDMDMMFQDCTNLVSLDLCSFDTTNVGGSSNRWVFENCDNLLLITISDKVSNILHNLPATQYYPAAGGDPVARANLTAGTWVRDKADLSMVTSIVEQAQMSQAISRRIGKLNRDLRAEIAKASAGSATSSVDVVRTDAHSTSYTKDTLEIVTDSTGKVTEMYFISA